MYVYIYIYPKILNNIYRFIYRLLCIFLTYRGSVDMFVLYIFSIM